MQIPLTPELERLIQEKVSSGRYASAIEVIGKTRSLMPFVAFGVEGAIFTCISNQTIELQSC